MGLEVRAAAREPMGEGRRSDLGLAVITAKANAYWSWRGQGPVQGGGAQPLLRRVFLGAHGQRLPDVASTEQLSGQQL